MPRFEVFYLHFRDAIITCIVNTLTCLIAGVLVFSILGYMAHVQETDIDNVVASGPGLVFVTYPDLVLNLPGSVLWALIFFTMLLVGELNCKKDNVQRDIYFSFPSNNKCSEYFLEESRFLLGAWS